MNLIDGSVIEQLVLQIGPQNMRTVVSKVEQDVPVQWQKLVQSCREFDSEHTERQLHSLASMFRSVGLIQIGDALASLEQNLRSGESIDIASINALEVVKLKSMGALTMHMEQELQLAPL
ncbi:MAG: Hpt domain-containing protein [Halioglobus sp.]